MQEIKAISTYKQSLKDKILHTAIKAFAEKGIRGVKMDDIAARLSISKRTMYEIYTNKEDLLFEGVKAYYHELSERMETIGKTSSNVMEIILKVYRLKVEEFKTTNPLFYADLRKYPLVLKYLDDERQTSRNDLMRFFERGVNEGYFRQDVNYELTSNLFEALGQYIMERELYKSYSIEELFNNLVFVSLRGFCTEKGVKALDKFF